jgi:hypothetical protein
VDDEEAINETAPLPKLVAVAVPLSVSITPPAGDVLVHAFDEIAESNVMFASNESATVGNDDATVDLFSFRNTR